MKMTQLVTFSIFVTGLLENLRFNSFMGKTYKKFTNLYLKQSYVNGK